MADSLSRAPSTCLLVGGADSGKSTLARWLADSLSSAGVTWLVDTDVGQNDLGPPAAMSAAPWGGSVEAIWFVGSTSPRGHLLPVLAGTSRLVEVARERGGRHVVVNTDGWVGEPAAVVLRQVQVDRIRPDAVVALTRGLELEEILAPYGPLRRPFLFRVGVSPRVRRRSPEERAGRRRASWRAYLASAPIQRLEREGTGFSGYPPEPGRLVGLFDPSNRCIGVGLVTETTRKELEVRAWTPTGGEIRRLHGGSLLLTSDLSERPWRERDSEGV